MARAYTVKADFSANFLTLNCRAFSAQVYRAYGVWAGFFANFFYSRYGLCG